MPTQQEVTNRGQGLSSFFTWDNSKVNPVLWFFLLFLNALYTVIGIRLRDLKPNGACELNVNRTIGRVEHDDRIGLYWGLWSIYPGCSFLILMVQIVSHVLHYCRNQENQGDLGNLENESDQTEQYRSGQRDLGNRGYQGVQVDQRDLGDQRDQGVQVYQRDLGGQRDQGVQVDQRDLGGLGGQRDQGVQVDQRDLGGQRNQGVQVDQRDLEDRSDQGVQVSRIYLGDRGDQGQQVDQRDLEDLSDQGVQVSRIYLGDQGEQVDQGVQVSRRGHEASRRHRILQEKQKTRGVQNVVEILHIALVNFLVIISGSLYIAADNFFFLVDPDDQNQNPSTERSFIAGSSLICSVLVFIVDYWFEHIVYKCLKTCNFVKETNDKPDNNENGLIVLRILYFWWPLAVLITTFDSLFISVVDEISGEDNVRSGYDCSNETGFKGAIIFYIAICIVFSICSGVFVVFKFINKLKYFPNYSSRNWNLSCCFAYLWYIVHFSFFGIVFIVTGLMFIAVDNNWPWICLAKNDSDICYWVIVRVGLLAVVTVFSILFFLSSAAFSLLKCCVKLEGNSNTAETTKKNAHTNEGVIVHGPAAHWY